VDVEILDFVLKDMILFVVKDALDQESIDQKKNMPGIIGCNVLNPLLDRVLAKYGNDFQSKLDSELAEFSHS